MAAPVISVQPMKVACNLGDNVSFTVEATGEGLTYQWYKNTDTIGPDSPVLQISGVQKSDLSPYFVVVSNIDGFVQSDIVVLCEIVTDTEVPERVIPSYVERRPLGFS